jgi:hypothetical protein
MSRIDRADYPELLRRERVAGLAIELRYKMKCCSHSQSMALPQRRL